MPNSGTVTVRVMRSFNVQAETVFDAWLDPDIARHFFFATPEGTMVRAEIEPIIGGTFLFVDRREGEEIEHVGTYLEIFRPRRLVFSFRVPKFQKNAPPTRVTIDIIPQEWGNSELTLTHEGVGPEFAGRTEKGWSMILDNLADAIGSS